MSKQAALACLMSVLRHEHGITGQMLNGELAHRKLKLETRQPARGHS